MFCDVKVYGFALIAVLAGASCAPTNSENTNPIFDNPCVKNCSITHDYTPSCGTDGQDYSSNSFYTCFDNCGINIKKASEGRCDQRSKMSVQNSEACMSRCPVTAYYNPFCGSDNVTYPTIGMLSCFQKCGINVTEVHRGKCKFPSALKNPSEKLVRDAWDRIFMNGLSPSRVISFAFSPP